jgi:serine/threonine protein kinase
MHKNKICHRDIKLANIAMFDGLNFKLIDFGLSMCYKNTYDKYRYSGTPGYIPNSIINDDKG